MRGASKLQHCPVCIVCFRKLEGPEGTPVQTKKLQPGERWQPCELCAGPCDAVPGIYMRLWRPPPEPPTAA
jgi:hypothetical protein